MSSNRNKFSTARRRTNVKNNILPTRSFASLIFDEIFHCKKSDNSNVANKTGDNGSHSCINSERVESQNEERKVKWNNNNHHHSSDEHDSTIDDNDNVVSSSTLSSPITTPFSQQQLQRLEMLDAVPEDDEEDKYHQHSHHDGNDSFSFMSSRLNFSIGVFVISFLFLMAGITPYWVRDKQGQISFNKIILVSTSLALLTYSIMNLTEELF